MLPVMIRDHARTGVRSSTHTRSCAGTIAEMSLMQQVCCMYALKTRRYNMRNNEVPLSQCPLCGSVTDPDAVDAGIMRRDESKRNIFLAGAFCGALGLGLLVLFFGTGSCPGIL